MDIEKLLGVGKVIKFTTEVDNRDLYRLKMREKLIFNAILKLQNEFDELSRPGVSSLIARNRRLAAHSALMALKEIEDQVQDAVGE